MFMFGTALCSTTHYFPFARMIPGKLPKKRKKDENDEVVWGTSKWFSAEWTDIVPAAAAIFCSIVKRKKEIRNVKAPVVLRATIPEPSPQQTVSHAGLAFIGSLISNDFFDFSVTIHHLNEKSIQGIIGI